MSKNIVKTVKNIEKSSKMSKNAEKNGPKCQKNREKTIKNIEKLSKMPKNAEKMVKIVLKLRKNSQEYRKIFKNVEKR